MSGEDAYSILLVIKGEAKDALLALAAMREIEVREVIQQALTTEVLLDEWLRAGKRLFIRDEQGEREFFFSGFTTDLPTV